MLFLDNCFITNKGWDNKPHVFLIFLGLNTYVLPCELQVILISFVFTDVQEGMLISLGWGICTVEGLQTLSQ